MQDAFGIEYKYRIRNKDIIYLKVFDILGYIWRDVINFEICCYSNVTLCKREISGWRGGWLCLVNEYDVFWRHKLKR